MWQSGYWKVNLEYYDRILTEILHLHPMSKIALVDVKEVYRMSINCYLKLHSRPRIYVVESDPNN